MKLKRTQIYIDKLIIKQLKHYAVEMDTSMAQVIRWIISSHLGLVTLKNKPFIESLNKKIEDINNFKH